MLSAQVNRDRRPQVEERVPPTPQATTPSAAAGPGAGAQGQGGGAAAALPAATGAGTGSIDSETLTLFSVMLAVLVLLAVVLQQFVGPGTPEDAGAVASLLSPATTSAASIVAIMMAIMSVQSSSHDPLAAPVPLQPSKVPASPPLRPVPDKSVPTGNPAGAPPPIQAGEPGYQPGEEVDGADPNVEAAAAAAAGAGGDGGAAATASEGGAAAEAEGGAAAAAEGSTSAFARADELHATFQLPQERTALQEALSAATAAGDVEGEAAVLWRLGRWANATSWRMAMAAGGPDKEGAADRDKRLAVLQEGWQALQRSLELVEGSADAHKWAAVVLAQVSPTTQERIRNAFVIRDHGRRAVELDPADVQARYILGAWAYTVAGVGWFERQAARAIFGSAPPEATYEEALEHFMKAEAQSPGFWMVNRLKIAQTQDALGNKQEARKWLAKALDMQHTPDEDRWGTVERQKLRQKLGM